MFGTNVYNPALLNLTSQISGVLTTTQLSLSGVATYQTMSTVDPVTGQPRSVTFNLYYGANPLLCSETLTPPAAGFHKRVTIRIKQANSGGVGCQLNLGACSTPSATKTVTCDRDVQLVEAVRSCSDVGARVVRRDSRCAPVRIQRTAPVPVIDANEAVFLSKLFNVADYVPTTSPSVDVKLLRDRTYAIDGTGLSTHSSARAYEITIDASSSSGAAFDTAFFKFVHAAHREQQNAFGAGTTQDLSVFVAMDKSTSIPRQVFHVETVQAGQSAPVGLASFYELPVGSYELRIFGGLNNVGTVYGNQNITSNPNASKSADFTQQVTLVANKFYVVVIQTGSQPYLTVKARVQDVTPVEPVNAGTNVKIYNEITSAQSLSAFGLISSTPTSCSVVTGSPLAAGAGLSIEINKIATTPQTYDITTSTSTCKAIESIGTLDIGADASTNGCVQRHIFVTGRTYQFNDTSTFAAPAGCSSTCSVGGPLNVCTNRLSTKYGDINFLGEIRTDTNAGSLATIVVEVPICKCSAPLSLPCTVDHCQLAGMLDDVGSGVSSAVSGVSSSVGAVAGVVRDTRDVCKSVGNDVQDFEKRYKNDQNDAEDTLNKIEDDVKKIGDIEDDVKKINDNVKSIKLKVQA